MPGSQAPSGRAASGTATPTSRDRSPSGTSALSSSRGTTHGGAAPVPAPAPAPLAFAQSSNAFGADSSSSSVAAAVAALAVAAAGSSASTTVTIVPISLEFSDRRYITLTQDVGYPIGRLTDMTDMNHPLNRLKFRSRVVSRQHAVLTYVHAPEVDVHHATGGTALRPTGIYLQDTASSSGTFVNEVRLQADGLRQIIDGDVIRLGEDCEVDGVEHLAVTFRILVGRVPAPLAPAHLGARTPAPVAGPSHPAQAQAAAQALAASAATASAEAALAAAPAAAGFSPTASTIPLSHASSASRLKATLVQPLDGARGGGASGGSDPRLAVQGHGQDGAPRSLVTAVSRSTSPILPIGMDVAMGVGGASSAQPVAQPAAVVVGGVAPNGGGPLQAAQVEFQAIWNDFKRETDTFLVKLAQARRTLPPTIPKPGSQMRVI
ncbi:hypothetical protein CXG81DRAFT_25215 [Caulochytrium protostelioides]|uniref:FHA domain-containing protein n=1 Tax=Caulochytrium protostelioides TaxID=1555241 RepID=A0A4P9WWJ5_9FUNG|nr:hypothetical protein CAUPRSCDRAFT_10635 [Caulochytrium protostelioides]RKP02129.1 hypothetical protein CXG81DRAFT_25215 [Caulochytrium protostelioides]|eukprot:RKP02129.1 hypothetical protein CXG81DRAFT_25215 [Caulochytrium protostelioides]